jgi:hypothetical protein
MERLYNREGLMIYKDFKKCRFKNKNNKNNVDKRIKNSQN